MTHKVGTQRRYYPLPLGETDKAQGQLATDTDCIKVSPTLCLRAYLWLRIVPRRWEGFDVHQVDEGSPGSPALPFFLLV